MSAEQSNCSLVDPQGTRKAIFLSECNAAIFPHLSTDHLSKCGNVTEAELIMTSKCGYWWDIGDTTHTHFHLPKAQALTWKILPGTKVMPGLAGKHVINFEFQMQNDRRNMFSSW